MSTAPDLSLPSRAPELGGWDDMPWDSVSFALCLMIDTTEETMTEIASSLEKEWWETSGYEGLHLVRVARDFNFKNRSLKDVGSPV